MRSQQVNVFLLSESERIRLFLRPLFLIRAPLLGGIIARLLIRVGDKVCNSRAHEHDGAEESRNREHCGNGEKDLHDRAHGYPCLLPRSHRSSQPIEVFEDGHHQADENTVAADSVI